MKLKPGTLLVSYEKDFLPLLMFVKEEKTGEFNEHTIYTFLLKGSLRTIGKSVIDGWIERGTYEIHET